MNKQYVFYKIGYYGDYWKIIAESASSDRSEPLFWIDNKTILDDNRYTPLTFSLNEIKEAIKFVNNRKRCTDDRINTCMKTIKACNNSHLSFNNQDVWLVLFEYNNFNFLDSFRLLKFLD